LFVFSKECHGEAGRIGRGVLMDSTMRTRVESTNGNGGGLLATDAAGIVASIFPAFSLRTWRRMDSSGRCPRGFKVGGRKLWRLADLQQWATLGFPDRQEFDERVRTDGESGILRN